jgi:hypothetical protein
MKGAQSVMNNANELKEKGRGSFNYIADANCLLCVERRLDCGIVNLASTHVGNGPGEPIQLWSGREKARISIDTPLMVAEYNTHMGGVDLANMLIALYRTNLGVKKAYHLLFVSV